MSRATTERVVAMQIHDANLKHNGNWSYRNSTSEIILHHAEASHASVEDINQWHLERGWAGIGYNYYVRKDGTIWRGRPEWAVGAHAKGHNDKSIGICCEGAYMTETMPAAQLAALKALIRDIMSRYGSLKLLRHKDVNETDCPGVNFPWEQVKAYAQPDAKKEDELVKIEKKKVLLNGKTYTCECITEDEVNYIKMRSLEQAGFTVVYDAVRKLPSITAPQCRTFVPDGTAEVQEAIDTVQEAAGLEKKTIEYLLRYEYGEELVKKLAKAMEK